MAERPVVCLVALRPERPEEAGAVPDGVEAPKVARPSHAGRDEHGPQPGPKSQMDGHVEEHYQRTGDKTGSADADEAKQETQGEHERDDSEVQQGATSRLAVGGPQRRPPALHRQPG